MYNQIFLLRLSFYTLTLLLPRCLFFFPRNVDVLLWRETHRLHLPPPIRGQKPASATFLHPFAVGNTIKENHSKSNFKLMFLCFQSYPHPLPFLPRILFGVSHTTVHLMQSLWIYYICLFWIYINTISLERKLEIGNHVGE